MDNLLRWSHASKRLAVIGAMTMAACNDGANARRGTDAAVVEARNGVRIVHNRSAPELMSVKRGIPSRARLLFAGVMAAAHRPDGTQAVVAADGSRILEFDSRGRFVRSIGDTTIIKAVGINSVRGAWVVTEREGRIVELDHIGRIVRSFPAPFEVGVVAALKDGYVASRSPFAIATKPLPPSAPLLVDVAPTGQIRATLDTVVPSSQPSATFLNNSGMVATAEEMIFFALFTRDEVRAYDLQGRLRWVSDRSLAWARPATTQPTATGTTLNFSAVNLGIAATSNGVFVLSHADSNEHRMRLDLLDPETGVLLWTAELPPGPWLLSQAHRGELWMAPADTLTALATPRARASLPPFRLLTISGDSFDLASTRGRVTLVNFWASWCPPCRDEFPLMNQLAMELANRPFTIVAVNEDVSEPAARAFLKLLPAAFVVPLGRGDMQARVGYRGLPYTVLLDHEGRIIERYFGFGGPAQFRTLRLRIDQALAALP